MINDQLAILYKTGKFHNYCKKNIFWPFHQCTPYSKPWACKKQALAACAAARDTHDARPAEEDSVYHWADFDIIVVGFPHEGEIQEFRQRCRQSRKTAELVQQRDNLPSRFLPLLRANGLIILGYATKFIQELYLMKAFWKDYCNPESLSIERVNTQKKIIEGSIVSEWKIV